MAIFTKKFLGPERGADQERNQVKYDNFGRMYGKVSYSEAEAREFEAKRVKMAEKASKSRENVQSDHEAPTSSSIREWVDLMAEPRKIDPNQAFKRHKNKLPSKTIEEIINSLAK